MLGALRAAGHSRPLRAVFEAVLRVLSPFADGRDPELLAEVGWSSIHGLVTLARDGRLPPGPTATGGWRCSPNSWRPRPVPHTDGRVSPARASSRRARR
nr:TetR-like C-terminal domain-containing protein [Nocardiopsis sp. YSL2]